MTVDQQPEKISLNETHAEYRQKLFQKQVEDVICNNKQKTTKLYEFVSALSEKFNDWPSSKWIPYPYRFDGLHFHNTGPEEGKSFEMPKPVDFQIIGGLDLNTLTKFNRRLDLAVTIPKEIFQSKDYLNYRYADKRSAYLGTIKHYLTREKWDGEVRIEFIDGDKYKPILVLENSRLDKWSIGLRPILPKDLFVPERLAYNRNNLRHPNPKPDTDYPTPCYNNVMLEEMLILKCHLFQKNVIEKWNNLADAIILMKKWSHNRGWGIFGLRGFAISMLACHTCVVQEPAIEASVLEIMKLTLGTLHNTDFTTHHLVCGQKAVKNEQEKTLSKPELCLQVDYWNILWRCSTVDVLNVVAKTLKELDASFQRSPYAAVFGTDFKFFYDYESFIVQNLEQDDYTVVWREFFGKLHEKPGWKIKYARTAFIMEKGLGVGDRLVSLEGRIINNRIVLGLNFNQSTYQTTIHKGPSQENAGACKEFRKIWGEKASLRRFKDGSILECISFEAVKSHTMERDKPNVAGQMVDHLLEHHLPGVTRWRGCSGLTSVSVDEGLNLHRQFDICKTRIFELKELPLSVKNIMMISPAFSFTEVRPKLYKEGGVNRTIQEVILEFENSGKWPSDTEAIRNYQIAFFLEMRSQLYEKRSKIEMDIHVSEEGFMDIVMQNYCFRMHIFHPFNVPLALTKPDTIMDKIKENDERVFKLRELWWKPRIRARMHAVANKFPAFPPTVKYIQRYMAAQLMSDYDDCVEHIVAYLFLYQVPFTTAVCGKNMGLARFLWFLSTWDFDTEPLLVPFEPYTEEETQLARQSWERKKRPAIYSNVDPQGIFCSMPPSIAFSWLKKRTLNALAIFEKNMLEGEPRGYENWLDVFYVDMATYDVKLHLKKKEGNVMMEETRRRFIDDLRKRFHNLCLICYDAQRDCIGIKWDPRSFLPSKEKIVGQIPICIGKPHKNDVFIPDTISILSSIVYLGEGIIDEIETEN